MYWMILCNDCCDEIDPERITGFFQAKFGWQGEGDGEGAVLACAPWGEYHGNDPVMQFFCDECGSPVAVAKSSQWFIDSHRKERDEQIGRT